MAAHYMTKAEYEAFCVAEVKMWATAYAKNHLPSYAEALSNAQYQLVKCGWSWEDVEELEIAAYQAA